MKRILCILLPDWPIQRRIAARPELRRQPLVLHAKQGSRGECIVSCSPAARQAGIRQGMPLTEAAACFTRSTKRHTAPPRNTRSLVPPRRQASSASNVKPEPPAVLHQEPHDAEADRVALFDLAAWCQRFSPIVGLEDVPEPCCLLLEITGLAMLFGGEEALAQRVIDEFQERGYFALAAVADTIGAAWAAVHFPQAVEGSLPSPGPQICCVPLGETLTALVKLPPAALRLPEETLQPLDELGIQTLRQLWAIPRPALAPRLGDLLVQRLGQLEGSVAEIIAGYRQLEELKVSWSLEHPTGKRAAIEHICQHLLEQLAQLLNHRDLGAVQFQCTLRLVELSPAVLSIGLFRPTARAEHLWDLVRLQLEQLALRAEVSSVAMEVVTAAALEVEQGELFPDRQRDAPRKLALLVDRLANRLGRQQVVAPKLLKQALPEKAWEDLPLTHQAAGLLRPKEAASRSSTGAKRRATGPKRRRGNESREPEAATLPLLATALVRPLVLHTPPVPLEVLAVAPDGPPVRLEFDGHVQEVVRYWGPERIETNWWRGRTVRRDYWRIETQSGLWLWLFRSLGDGNWFLHGEFA